jgi:outer membrane protein assembly factor BamB
MKHYSVYFTLFLFSAFLFTTTSESVDWHQWQGPDRNAISKETGLLKEWGEGGPPLAWKNAELGTGYSTPSIANGKIFGISNREGNEVAWALSETDGKELWAIPIGQAQTEGMPQGIEGTGCTPTVDGDLLYVLGYGGDLACLQAKDGNIVWQKNLLTDFGGVLPTWRYNESPLIDGDKLICTPGGDEITMVALNKLTGETIWKNHIPKPNAESDGGGQRGGGRGGFRDSGAAYSSAIAIDFGGVHQYVQFLSKGVVGVAASDGKLLWRYDNPANQMGINCSTPIYIDGQVFAASAYGAGGGLAKLSKDGDGFKAEEIWFSKKMENHHGCMVVIDGCLYGANGGNGGGYLVCLDFKTGDVLWDERANRGVKKGSVAFADGRIYYRTEEGSIHLIEPSREKYTEHGKFDQPDRTRQPAWSHPVIANGKLYIRDQDLLLCYDIQAK